MKKSIFTILSCALLAAPAMMAEEAVANEANAAQPVAEAVAEPAAEPQCDLGDLLKKMPVKLSGYLQTGWNFVANENSSKNSSSFQAKRLRLIMDGKVSESVDFRLQIEAFNGIAGSTNGNGQKNIQVMDAFATWKICPEFKVRAGQFYTPLGYENYDISPATLETVDFSNIVYRIACRNPYSYNFIDYGRDLGVMIIGDIDKYFHYDFAVTNGSIPCKDDNNKTKDIYASVTIKPFKNFNVKATYNWGEYNPQALAGGKAPGFTEDGVVSKYMPMNRFVAGLWYNDPTGLDFRAEYGFMKSKKDDVKYVDEQGAYVLLGYHAGKFLPIVRWDMYKDKINDLTTNNYNRILAGVTYQLFKNVKIQLNYGHYMYSDKVKDANPARSTDQIQLMGLFKF